MFVLSLLYTIPAATPQCFIAPCDVEPDWDIVAFLTLLISVLYNVIYLVVYAMAKLIKK